MKHLRGATEARRLLSSSVASRGCFQRLLSFCSSGLVAVGNRGCQRSHPRCHPRVSAAAVAVALPNNAVALPLFLPTCTSQPTFARSPLTCFHTCLFLLTVARMIGQLYHRHARATLRGICTELKRTLLAARAVASDGQSHRVAPHLHNVMSTRPAARARRGDRARILLAITLIVFTALVGVLGFSPAP